MGRVIGAAAAFLAVLGALAPQPAAASCPIAYVYEVHEPTWSPDGRRLAFVRGSDIWVIGADGSGLVNLTNDPFTDRFSPAWSPDGRTIAFVSEGDIWLIDVHSLAEARLTTLGGSDPAWSPDGRTIAFASRRNGGELYLMNADGSMQTSIVRTETWINEDPGWSPDGSRIAFTSYRDNGNAEIYVARRDGGAQTRLTTDVAYDSDPTWSPDGEQIAWRRAQPPDPSRAVIHLMESDGSNQRPFPASGEFAFGPAWSPDGSQLAFGTVLGGLSELKIAGIAPAATRIIDEARPRRHFPSPSVEISSSRVVIEFGSDLQLRGDVLVLSGGCTRESLVGTKVTVSSRKYDDSVMRRRVEFVNQSGGWTWVDAPDVETTYEARIGRRLASETTVYVRPKLTLARVAGRRGLLEATAQSLHAYAGKYVLVQRRTRRGRWVTLRRVMLGPGSSARFRAPKGGSRLRAYMPQSQAGSGYVEGFSPSIPVRR